jgi:hypothetical protein
MKNGHDLNDYARFLVCVLAVGKPLNWITQSPTEVVQVYTLLSPGPGSWRILLGR